MIGKLRGIIDETGPDWVVIDVHGVGFLAACSATTLRALGGPGDGAVLYVETYVREDQLKLFGFATQAEREWFNLLQTVQRVGAKAALAVLSALDPAALARAIALKDARAIAAAQGIGPKVAERIVSELKDKVPPGLAAAAQAGDEAGSPAPPASARAESDAVSALVNLGYSPAQAAQAVARVAARLAEEGAGPPGTERLIRDGLKELAG